VIVVEEGAESVLDEMASVGRKLEDEELVSYILTGLDVEFNPVVSAVAAQVEPILWENYISNLLVLSSGWNFMAVATNPPSTWPCGDNNSNPCGCGAGRGSSRR